MNQERKKPVVLIIHPGTLGDVMLSLTAIDGLRCRFHDHELILSVRGEIGQILLEYDVVDRVVNIDETMLSELYSEYPQLGTDSADILARCRYAVVWVNDLDGRLFVNLQSLGVENISIISPHDDSLHASHQSDRYCESVMEWLKDKTELIFPDPFRLRVKGHGGKKVFLVFPKRHDRKVLMIHPGTGSRHKCLRQEKMGAVIRQFSESQDCQMILCQGPADENILLALQPYIHQVPHKILKNASLPDMAKALREADMFLGHDSGLTHFAAALGVPTIALFGPTDPLRWGPKGTNVEILQGPCCQCQDWNAVQQCTEKICLTHSVEDIVQAVERLLAHSGKVDPFVDIVRVH